MRRIDAIVICLGFALLGVVAYFGLQWLGLPTDKTEIWTPVILVAGLLAWLGSYGTRVVRGKMTYHQQLADYQKAVLQKKLAEMSPEAIAQLLQETEGAECKE